MKRKTLFIVLFIAFFGFMTQITLGDTRVDNIDVVEFKVSAVLNGTGLYTYITNMSKHSIELRMDIGDKRGSRFSLYNQEGIQVGRGGFYDVNGSHKILLSPSETRAFYNGIRESAQNASCVSYCLAYENPLNSQIGSINQNVGVSIINDLSRNINVVGISGEPVFLPQDIEKKTEFPGGNNELLDYISRNLEYPKWDVKDMIRIIVGVVIEKDGTMSHLHICRSSGNELDSLALKVFDNPPQWTPGYKDGKPVRVYFTIPVMFRMQ